MGCLQLSNKEIELMAVQDNNFRGTRLDPMRTPLVLSLSNSFFLASKQDAYKFYTPTDAFENRIFAPIATIFNNKKNHFFKSYESGASFVDGLVYGLLLPGLTAISPSAAVGVCIAALMELVIGIGSMAKACFYSCKGETEKAKRYAWDGLSRIMMFPALLVTSLFAMPVEVIRFLTRSIATLVELAKPSLTLPPAQSVVQPVAPQPVMGVVTQP